MSLKDSKLQFRPVDWLRYSGACVTVSLNPCHWTLVPRFYMENDVWLGPNERTWSMSWLMIGLRVWVDDGSW